MFIFTSFFFLNNAYGIILKYVAFEKTGGQREESLGSRPTWAVACSSGWKSEWVHRWRYWGVAGRGIHPFLGLWICQNGGRQDGYHHQGFTETLRVRRLWSVTEGSSTQDFQCRISPGRATADSHRATLQGQNNLQANSLIWRCLERHSNVLLYLYFSSKYWNWKSFWQ